MNILTHCCKQRTLWLVVTSLLVGAMLGLLTFTDWAEGLRVLDGTPISTAPAEDAAMPAIHMFIAPFIKEFVLIGVPLAIALFMGRLYKKLIVKR